MSRAAPIQRTLSYNALWKNSTFGPALLRASMPRRRFNVRQNRCVEIVFLVLAEIEGGVVVLGYAELRWVVQRGGDV